MALKTIHPHGVILRLVKVLMVLTGLWVTVLPSYGEVGSSLIGRDTITDQLPASIPTGPVRLAYVSSTSRVLPLSDPNLFTHYIYAFGEFNQNNNGVVINNTSLLSDLSNFKKVNPSVRVILGIGGSKREGFSEMAASASKREAFANSCKSIIKSYGLDGVDLDWEAPGTENGGHTASPDDAQNYIEVVKKLREVLGRDKWISVYSLFSAAYIDFKGMLPYVDFFNVSGYDLYGLQTYNSRSHHSNLHKSNLNTEWCIETTINRHISYGVPPRKILLGIPFYAKYIDVPKLNEDGEIKAGNMSAYQIPNYCGNDNTLKLLWDATACAPYYATYSWSYNEEKGIFESKTTLKVTFDNEQSISNKIDYAKEKGLKGVFVWHYSADYDDQRLAKKIKEKYQEE